MEKYSKLWDMSLGTKCSETIKGILGYQLFMPNPLEYSLYDTVEQLLESSAQFLDFEIEYLQEFS